VILRDYQSRSVADLFAWWTKHQDNADIPLLVLPTGSGKSVICAEIVRQMWEQWPEYRPRTVVLVPSKELAEQNAGKLQALLPDNIHVGYVSASLGKKQHHADVIVATIGSIHKSAHLLGDIKVVIIDEAHLVSPKASDAGMYRTFLAKLGEICQFRTVGMTATPFRGNQVWLTDGDEPLFTGIASNVSMRELLDQDFLAPLIPPAVKMTTRIDASQVGISNGDYKIGELSAVVDTYLLQVAREAVYMASQRTKWIAFTPSVANAESLADKLCELGIGSAVVCGETPAPERADLIRQFKAGQIHCLVTVLALSVGFDVPDVDCIIWCRPTKSPVLYVQGMGRGTRIADGKTDCLVLDFTDTVERLGPVDIIKGRAKVKRSGDQEGPYSICPECGERNAPAALVCAHCGAIIREEIAEPMDAKVSYAALLSAQRAEITTWHDVTRVDYKLHRKPGKPDSMRVDYYSGLLRVASEWVCVEHTGYARQKAINWLNEREANQRAHKWWVDHSNDLVVHAVDTLNSWSMDVNGVLDFIDHHGLKEPTRIAIKQNGKFTEVKEYEFSRTKRHQDAPEQAIERS
jgi:DNA repair protein RadD